LRRGRKRFLCQLTQRLAARRGRLLRRLGFLQSFLPCEWWSLGQTQLCALINKLQNYYRSSDSSPGILLTGVAHCG
jgi:hypothetical protein